MKSLIVVSSLLLLSLSAAGADHPVAPAQAHRYMIERTFLKGALDRLDAETKSQVNANNASVGVRWIQSFTNPDKTKTYCLYEGPSEAPPS